MAISRPFRIFPRRASVPRSQSNKRISIPPPIGGWNSRDEPINMAPTDAGDLINLIPRTGFVQMRSGYASHSTGNGSGDCDLCVEFYDGTNRQLLTASPTNIYNATASGASTSLGAGFTNGRWDTGILGGIMGFVNGADAPQKYDGTTLSAMTLTGPTATNVIGMHIFKSRSYFWEDNDPNFWYSAVNTLGGTVTEFPLGNVAKKGGRLLRMTSWTVDGGAGPDDYAVFIMDTGEVIVYQGSDPGSATDWALVGIYTIGRPINDRAIVPLGGQIMVVTESDLVTLPEAFNNSSPPPTKLSGAISDAVFNFGTNDGWQIFHYPIGRLLMINVPTATSPDEFEQYVINLETGAPCRFTSIPSRVWGLYDGNPYFGSTDGVVYQFDTGTSDAGSDIEADAITGWTDLGVAENKMVSAFRPVFEVIGALSYGAAIGFDYDEPTASIPSSSGGGGSPWGSSWGSPWGSGTMTQKTWNVANGNGQHLSTRLRFARTGDTPRWLRTDYLVKRGGNL